MKIKLSRNQLIEQKGFEFFQKYKKYSPVPDVVEIEVDPLDVEASSLEIEALYYLLGKRLEEEIHEGAEKEL